MKVYSVKPNSLFVKVSDGRTLAAGPDITIPEVIVADVLGNETEAKKYLRYKWRWIIFDQWKDTVSDRAVTEDQIRGVIAQIDDAAVQNAPLIARQQRERPQYVTDRAGPDQAWDKEPKPRVNYPWKEPFNVNTKPPSDDPDTG